MGRNRRSNRSNHNTPAFRVGAAPSAAAPSAADAAAKRAARKLTLAPVAEALRARLAELAGGVLTWADPMATLVDAGEAWLAAGEAWLAEMVPHATEHVQARRAEAILDARWTLMRPIFTGMGTPSPLHFDRFGGQEWATGDDLVDAAQRHLANLGADLAALRSAAEAMRLTSDTALGRARAAQAADQAALASGDRCWISGRTF